MGKPGCCCVLDSAGPSALEALVFMPGCATLNIWHAGTTQWSHPKRSARNPCSPQAQVWRLRVWMRAARRNHVFYLCLSSYCTLCFFSVLEVLSSPTALVLCSGGPSVVFWDRSPCRCHPLPRDHLMPSWFWVHLPHYPADFPWFLSTHSHFSSQFPRLPLTSWSFKTSEGLSLTVILVRGWCPCVMKGRWVEGGQLADFSCA